MSRQRDLNRIPAPRGLKPEGERPMTRVCESRPVHDRRVTIEVLSVLELLSGALSRNRTEDISLTRRVLYQLR